MKLTKVHSPIELPNTKNQYQIVLHAWNLDLGEALMVTNLVGVEKIWSSSSTKTMGCDDHLRVIPQQDGSKVQNVY